MSLRRKRWQREIKWGSDTGHSGQGGKVALFRHNGKSGDLIYALPTVKKLGGGVLYMDVRPTHQNQGWPNYEALIPLLKCQPYLEQVIVEKEPKFSVDYDFAGWNDSPKLWSQHLSMTHADKFGVGKEAMQTPWLTVEPQQVAPILLSRSLRTHGPPGTFWEKILPQLQREQCAFLGLPEEHEAFERAFGFGSVRYVTDDLLTVARAIAGCKQFIGNQSAALAIAEGLGVNIVVEVGVPGHYAVNPWDANAV